MDLEILLGTKAFLDELSVSIRNIILSSFPNMTAQEKEEADLEVKLKLWRKVARGKKINNLRSYLWRAVYTTALDLIAERKDFLPIDQVLRSAQEDERMPAELTAPDRSSEAREYRLQLEEAVGSLPERRRAVAKLYLAGEGIPAIAASLGWRENQVRHLLYRGLADIKKKMILEAVDRDAENKDPRGDS
jgi:RNA polymerase sigma factor (sigma-70 family)